MRANEFLSELFQPGKKNWEWDFRGSEEAVANFTVGNITYRFLAYSETPGGQGAWEVEFKNADRKAGRTTKFGLTGTGNSAEVMSIVADIMREFLQLYQGKVTSLVFSADEESRQSLYARMAKRLLPTWELSQNSKQFILSAPQQVDEQARDELVKNRWALIVSDPEKHTWAPNLIDLVKNAYQNTSLGSFVNSAKEVAASDWVALDWDPQPDLDCTVFYRKARPNESWTGYKIQGIGHDGKSESKQKVIGRVKALLTKPGTWIESSDAMARTLGKLGMQPVTDEQTLNTLFPGSNLKMLDQNGNYERDAGSSRIREQVFGNPVTK